MQFNKNITFFSAFKWVFSHLPELRKKQFWLLFGGMLASALFETAALGSLAFFASSIADPSNVFSSKYIHYIKIFIPPDFLNSAQNLILFSGVLMIVLITGKNIFKAIISYGVARYSVAVEAYFGERLLSGFLNLPYKWHLTQNTSDLITAVGWRNFLGRSFFQPCLSMFNDVVMVLIMMFTLVFVQPAVSLIVIGTLSSTAYFIYAFLKKKLDETSRIGKNYQLDINKDVSMSIHGIKDVKISQKENAFVQKFMNRASPLTGIFGMQTFYANAPVLILETMGFGMLFFTIWLMFNKFYSTTAYVTGIMTLLSVTAWKTLPAVSQILNSATAIRKSLPYIKNQIDYFVFIEDNMDHISSQVSIHRPRNLSFQNRIRFKDVDFFYSEDGGKILDQISFEIKKGETVGIIGPSGAGKSTLADLIIGLQQPANGKIHVDDQELSRDNLHSWLRLIGYVPQFPYIFDGTLAENIAFGELGEHIDRDRVLTCCNMASMDDFLDDLPTGIDSFIGERGVRLSGGQQQRVAIARALYKKPEVIIFDEATSSLDTKSENKIQETIYKLKGKQTLIIIAHRLSTIEKCDFLIWIERGHIKMLGCTPDVLELYISRRAY